MPDCRFPFRFYDPTTDRRLAPSEAELFAAHPRAPFALFHTVRQAKKLIGNLDREAIVTIADSINQLDMEAPILRIGRMQQLGEEYASYSDEAENLRLALAHGQHDLAPQTWPAYMGVLALSLAGQIHNELWPTADYQHMAAAESGANAFSPMSENHLQRLATAAAKATAYGEAFRDILAADAMHREANRKNASKAHQRKHDIVDKFIAWALNLPQPSRFTSTVAAVEWFRAHHLNDEERLYASAYNFPRTLSEKLKTHVQQHNIRHPFQKS